MDVFNALNFFLYRFCAIVHPLKQLARNKRITVIISLVIIWTCALSQLVVRHTVVVFRNVPFNETRGPNGSTYSCHKFHKSKYYFIIIFLLYNVFPLVVVFYLYTRIIIKLQSRNKELKQKCSKRSPRDNIGIVNRAKNQRKIVIMLVIVPIVFVVCGWPITILHIILTSTKRGCINGDLLSTTLFRILGFLPAAMNPIIYNVFSQKFRTGFLQVFSSICKRKL